MSIGISAFLLVASIVILLTLWDLFIKDNYIITNRRIIGKRMDNFQNTENQQ